MGFSTEEARSLAKLPPQMQQEALKQKLQAPQRQAFGQALSQILGGPEEDGQGTDISKLGLTEDQAIKLAQLEMAKGKETAREKASRFKETKEVRKDILETEKSAQENAMRYDRMQKLNDKGTLIPGAFNAALKKFGLDIESLKNPDSQEFEKLSVDMLKNARQIFGSRVTNFEVQMFLKAIPNLSQSQEGRNRVLRNLKIMNEGNFLRAKEMRSIIKENNGVPPYDLAEQIQERVGPELDKLSKEFTTDVPAETVETKEQNIPIGSVKVQSPSGEMGYIPQENLEAALKAGYKSYGN